MTTGLRPIGYEDRLSLVEHLTELRARLVVCIAAFLVCFGICFWQNGWILDTMNVPLEKTAFKKGSDDPFERAASYQQAQKRLYLQAAVLSRTLAREKQLSPAARAELAQFSRQAATTAAATPKATPKRPVTLGVGEPFTATFKVASYAALLLALPVILYEIYAFVLPAFSPR